MASNLPSTMRVIDIKDGKGPISNLYVKDDQPLPKPSKTQALIKIHSFGLNRMDLLQREGKYPLPPQAGPIMGVEFSGTIVSFGSADHGGEKDLKEGDEVFGLAYGGAYAEYIASSTHMLLKKPKELSWEQAAGIPETWITATQALWMIGEFSEGKSVLWHAGASSVSIAGIQLSKANGASKVLVTASSQDKIDFCKSLGADEGFSYKEGDGHWEKKVLEYTDGKGVDIIVDFVGGTYFAGNLEAAARDGRIVNLATLGGMQIPDGAGANLGNFVKKRLRFEGSSLRSRDEIYQGKLRDQLHEHALPKFVDGSFKVPIEKVFKFEEIKEAHELMESNKTKGKLIVNVN